LSVTHGFLPPHPAPTAISTILMAEAYGVKQKIASKILFTTTLISIITIPLLKIFINLFI